MRPLRSTTALYQVADRRLARLRSALPVGTLRMSPATDRATSFVALELMNHWVLFSRSLYLSSCRGAIDGTGAKVTCTVLYIDDNESLRIAANVFRRMPLPVGHAVTHRDEPDWLDPTNLLKVLDNVQASNYPNVAAALSLRGRSLRDLPSVRNFFGHRGQNTAAKVLGTHGVIQYYSVPPAEHPTEFCLSHEPNASHSVLGTWLEEIGVIQEFACL